MVLRQLRLGFGSRARNLEVVLLGLTGAFVVVGWRSLDAAGFEMSETSSRAMTNAPVRPRSTTSRFRARELKPSLSWRRTMLG